MKTPTQIKQSFASAAGIVPSFTLSATAIETAKNMNNEPVKFTLIGDGTEKINLIKKAKDLDNIIFLDPVPKLLIPELISNYHAILISLKGVKLFDIADDLSYKNKKNFTLLHFQERINIYNEEQFDYRIDRVNI